MFMCTSLIYSFTIYVDLFNRFVSSYTKMIDPTHAPVKHITFNQMAEEIASLDLDLVLQKKINLISVSLTTKKKNAFCKTS